MLTKNHRDTTLTLVAAKICNSMLLNRIRSYLEPIPGKNQNGFRNKRSTEGLSFTLTCAIEKVKPFSSASIHQLL